MLTSNDVLNIPEFARQLFDALWLDYSEHGDAETLFVVHSMGGLVVKQALITAYNTARYSQIKKNIIGIVFFGTPHRAADYTTILRALLDFSFPTRKFVNDLLPVSQTIREINNAFADRAQEMQLASFWETAEMTWGGIVVPDVSGTLGFPGEIRVPLNGNHSTIVKYGSPEDNNFQVVSRAIVALFRDSRTKAQADILLPFHRNPQFTGNDKFLAIIKEALATEVPMHFNHRIVLYGMGGIGKTQCALEYAYRNKASYQRIYWLSAVDQASLFSDYQRVANEVGLRELKNMSPVGMVKAIVAWLSRESNWLIIIDNLDDIAIVDGFLPENGPGKHTLITTRNPHTTSIPAEPLEVPLLSMEDSINLLSTLSGIVVVPNSQEAEMARKIIEVMGYLPLAITQAASYIREVSVDFAYYLDEYFQNRKELNQWIPSGNIEYPYSVATTWSMSIQYLRVTHPAASQLLQLFSFLNPDGILIEFLLDGIDALEPDLQQIISNRIELAKALWELEKVSLIKWDREHKLISIHRLIQAIVTDDMSNDVLTSNIETIIDLCLRSFPEEVANDTRPICRKYQAQVMVPLTGIKMPPSEKSALIRARVGVFLRDDGKYNDAVRFLLQAVDIYTDLGGPEDNNMLTAMDNLASTYCLQGRTTEAERLEASVLEKRRRVLGEEHPDTLSTMHNLAWTYCQQGRTTEGADLGKYVLETRRRVLGEEHLDTLRTMDNLASSYWREGRTTEAVHLEEAVLEKRRGILGEENVVTMTTLHNLALTYSQLGRMTEAAELQENVLERSRRIIGEDHPITLAIMHTLASTYWQQGRMIEATHLEEEVLEKRKRILGEEHPSTLATMHNLATTYRQEGRTTEAAQLQENVLEKFKRILGEGHPHTLTTMRNLAKTYEQQGRVVEAGKLREEASRN